MKSQFLVLLVLAVWCVPASADLVDVPGVMNIFFGTATLSAGGSPESQTMAVTAETSIAAGLPADVVDAVLLGLGPGIVDQLVADPTVTPVIPAFVLSALPGLEDANGLGFDDTGTELALPALLSSLETQSVLFDVASDTGPQYPSGYSNPPPVFTYESDFGPYASNPDTTYAVDINVNFYEDDLQLVQTPEPSALVLEAGALIGVLLMRRIRLKQALRNRTTGLRAGAQS